MLKEIRITVWINEEEEAVLQEDVELTNATIKEAGCIPDWTIEKELLYACQERIDSLKNGKDSNRRSSTTN